MKKAIVTTTINPPTEALKKFIKIAKTDDWHLFIVGDKKTPHKDYQDIAFVEECVTYLHPTYQEQMSQELSDLIGWNCIQRRNFGLIEAYKWGADVIATVDDDNIPYPAWGKNVRVNKKIFVSHFKTDEPVFDPLSPVFPHLWHRGFPIQRLDARTVSAPTQVQHDVLVQADFWDGAPDVDAICRITLNPQVKFNPNMIPFSSNAIMPFNSQNTFLSRKVFPTYFLFPHIGRMDDIWAAYVTQFIFPKSVIFSKASVWQDRNPHDLTKDLEAELIGYRHSQTVVNLVTDQRITLMATILAGLEAVMPAESLQAYAVYKKLITGAKENWPSDDIKA